MTGNNTTAEQCTPACEKGTAKTCSTADTDTPTNISNSHTTGVCTEEGAELPAGAGGKGGGQSRVKWGMTSQLPPAAQLSPRAGQGSHQLATSTPTLGPSAPAPGLPPPLPWLQSACIVSVTYRRPAREVSPATKRCCAHLSHWLSCPLTSPVSMTQAS